MTDIDIKILGYQLKQGQHLAWHPDSKTCRKIVRIGTEKPAREDDVPEPGPIAYFSDGDYVAFWNCEPEHFVRIMPIFS